MAGGELAVKGGTMLKCSGSNTFPETNVTGNVSEAVLNSLCPRSQNSKWVNVTVCHLWFKLGTGVVYLGADLKQLRYSRGNHLRSPHEYQCQLTSSCNVQIKNGDLERLTATANIQEYCTISLPADFQQVLVGEEM